MLASLQGDNIVVKNFFWLLLMVLSFTGAGKAQGAVVSVSLSGPLTIDCGGSAEYPVTFTGTYNAFHKFNVFWDAYDRDVLFDDHLATGLSMSLDGEAGTSVVASSTFTLTCVNCIVTGPIESSGEKTAEVFVIARDLLIGGNTKESNELSVTCVPEPTTAITFVSGMLGLVIRKVRRSKPKLAS